MKKLLAYLLMVCITFGMLSGCQPPEDEAENYQPPSAPDADRGPGVALKPVIYLYPETETEVSVTLDYAGELTVTYPTYNGGWQVLAHPDGTLTNLADGREYSYLFWEGIDNFEYDTAEGFVVRGADTVSFLQEKLAHLGLTPKEYNEFIVYWLPKMQENAYNLISFRFSEYTEKAVLNIDPAPDSVLRVFMTFEALDEPVDIPEQTLPNFTREGFTVVEWGGRQIN